MPPNRGGVDVTPPGGWDVNHFAYRGRCCRVDALVTDGSYSVALNAGTRTFAEPENTAATVTTNVWVRTLPKPFAGTVDEAWLKAKLADTSPDVLALSMEYVQNAGDVRDSSGLRIAGDADYGPLQADGTRQEGSDFNDYLGVSWTYGTTVDAPEAEQIGALDCSGYMRMVWGYRTGLPLSLSSNGSSLPRRAWQMLDSAMGVVTIPNTGAKATNYKALQAGDLVFFDASTDDGTAIDHVGMYLGVDSNGRHRFTSSRKKVNGPTLGDNGGLSVLDGTNLYGTTFRAARRL